MNARFRFWCPNMCGKRVEGLRVCQKGWKDERRFVCMLCKSKFKIEELEACGNNINRVIKQRTQSYYTPKIVEGDNEW